MNIREMAVEYVRKHPGCTSKQIADGAGISRRLIQPLMAELFAAESVARDAPKGQPFVYRIPDGSELANLNKEYLAYRLQAMELEKKRLWRRAARVWLLAMDSTRNEAARDKAAARREQCIAYGCTTGRRWDDLSSSIASVSVPALDVWSGW